LEKYFQELGDPFVDGVANQETQILQSPMLFQPFWMDERGGGSEHCVYFYKKLSTGICPKNTKRKSNATVWTPISIFHEKGGITE
jgi:hypothetical protein